MKHNVTLDEWLKAIPQYPKAEGELRVIDGPKLGYCCLGVLADISPTHEFTDMGAVDTLNTDLAPSDCMLPYYVQSEYDNKFTIEFADFSLSMEEQDQLATINDESTTWEPVIAKIRELKQV